MYARLRRVHCLSAFFTSCSCCCAFSGLLKIWHGYILHPSSGAIRHGSSILPGMKNLFVVVLCGITFLAVAADLWTRRPLVAHAQSKFVYIERMKAENSYGSTGLRGSTIVGFSCSGDYCFVASE
jgi:hypothetical protein